MSVFQEAGQRGGKKSGKRYSPEVKRKVFEIFMQGELSTIQISERMNIPYGTISRWVRGYKRVWIKHQKIKATKDELLLAADSYIENPIATKIIKRLIIQFVHQVEDAYDIPDF